MTTTTAKERNLIRKPRELKTEIVKEEPRSDNRSVESSVSSFSFGSVYRNFATETLNGNPQRSVAGKTET